MRKKKDVTIKKDSREITATNNPFTQAVKKASGEEDGSFEKEETFLNEADAPDISLKARDELMRAQQAKNDTSVEGEKFRRDGD